MERATETVLWGTVNQRANTVTLQTTTGRRQTNLGVTRRADGTIQSGVRIEGLQVLESDSYIRCNKYLASLMPTHAETCCSCGKRIADVCGIRGVKDGVSYHKQPTSTKWGETRLTVRVEDGAKSVWLCPKCSTDADAMRTALRAQPQPEFAALCSTDGKLDYPLFVATLWNEHNDTKLHAQYPAFGFTFGRTPCYVLPPFVNEPNARTLSAAARMSSDAETRKTIARKLPAKHARDIVSTDDSA